MDRLWGEILKGKECNNLIQKINTQRGWVEEADKFLKSTKVGRR